MFNPNSIVPRNHRQILAHVLCHFIVWSLHHAWVSQFSNIKIAPSSQQLLLRSAFLRIQVEPPLLVRWDSRTDTDSCSIILVRFSSMAGQYHHPQTRHSHSIVFHPHLHSENQAPKYLCSSLVSRHYEINTKKVMFSLPLCNMRTCIEL